MPGRTAAIYLNSEEQKLLEGIPGLTVSEKMKYCLMRVAEQNQASETQEQEQELEENQSMNTQVEEIADLKDEKSNLQSELGQTQALAKESQQIAKDALEQRDDLVEERDGYAETCEDLKQKVSQLESRLSQSVGIKRLERAVDDAIDLTWAWSRTHDVRDTVDYLKKMKTPKDITQFDPLVKSMFLSGISNESVKRDFSKAFGITQ